MMKDVIDESAEEIELSNISMLSYYGIKKSC